MSDVKAEADFFQVLRENRHQIWRAELAAWYHNAGKLNPEFFKSGNISNENQLYNYRNFPGYLHRVYEPGLHGVAALPKKERPPRVSVDGLKKTESWFDQENLQRWLRETRVVLPEPLNDREYTVAELIELQDYDWHRAGAINNLGPKSSNLSRLFEFVHDRVSHAEKEREEKPLQGKIPLLSTIFGYEVPVEESKWRELWQRVKYDLTAPLSYFPA